MRYVVTELEGYRTLTVQKPGIATHVVDALTNHQLIRTWHSEDYEPQGKGQGWAREHVRTLAANYAQALNEGRTPTTPRHRGFLATCPNPSCAERCASRLFRCPVCGTRLGL